MINLVQQTIEYFVKNKKEPDLSMLNIEDKGLVEGRWCCFVTVYLNGDVRWSAWNIKELEENLAKEIVKNTVEAISKDTRFSPVSEKEVKDLKIRLDIIKDRKILKEGMIKDLDPVKVWVMAIKKDWEKLAVILPNISPKLLTWEDFIPVLKSKLWGSFEEKDYQLQEVFTEVHRNY